MSLTYSKTPLTIALSCGKKQSGDVRLVRMLIKAKADVLKLTSATKALFKKGKQITHIDFARKYSNQKCIVAIEKEIALRKG